MRRLTALAAAAALALPLAASADPFAGHARTASATFRLRGLDGHVITVALVVRGSGLVASERYARVEMAVTDCAGTRCAPVRRYTTSRVAGYYGSSDLSVTSVAVLVGRTAFSVMWWSEPGYGSLPPTASADGGVALVSGRSALAVLLAGPHDRGRMLRATRCTDTRARVESVVAVSTADAPGERWPADVAPGLRVKPLSPRMFGCA